MIFRRLAWLLGILAACLTLPASAQTYAFRSEAFVYDTPSSSARSVTWHASGTSPACTSYPNGDDDWADISFPDGFSFRFAGVRYTQLRVNSNGSLVFGADTSGFHRKYSATALPATAGGSYSGCTNSAPVRIMFPYWTDIVAGSANNAGGESIKYELLGTAPNRRFVISWVNVKLYGTSTRYNFQVVLWENTASTDSEFSYRYTSGSSTGSGAAVGVQVSATDYTQYAFNQSFIDTTIGTSIRWYPIAVSPAQVGEYRLDDSSGWLSTPQPGEVIADTSGAGNSALRVGAGGAFPQALLSANVCNGATIPSNTSASGISAINIRQTPAQIGQAASMTFWYRSTQSWGTNSNSTLFDATSNAAAPFHLTKMRSGTNDVLRFSLTDANGTVRTLETGDINTAANTWVHVGVSWYVASGTNQTVMQIFLNGQQAAFGRFTTSGALHASLASLYFGDNRTSGVVATNGTANSAYGDLDEIRLYNFDISASQARRDMQLTRANCAPLNHFAIIHSGSGSACQPNEVTIRAHDINHNPVTMVGTVMSISTSVATGAWASVDATGTLTNLSNGSASYVWNNESEVTLGYRATQTGSVNFNVLSGAANESSGSSLPDHDLDMAIGSCVSRFNACEVTSPRCDPSVSGGPRLLTKLAGTAFAFDGVAQKADGSLESGFSGNLTVDLLANTAAGVALDTSNCPVSASQVISLGTVAFSAGRGAINNISVPTAYRDVRVRFSCSAAECGQTIRACSTDNFAVRPAAFTVTANLGGSTLKAGHSFTMSANSGVGAQYSGTPVLDSSKVVDHAGASAGTLAGTFPATANGVSTGGFAYHDVGTLSLQANAVSDAVYASVDSAQGDCVAGSSSNTPSNGRYGCSIGSLPAGPFGRFYPDHFTYAATLSAACSGFVYMGQAALGINLSLEARSANNAVTPRYTAGYGYLGTPSISGDNSGSTVDVSRLSPALPASAWTLGRYGVALSGVTFQRSTSPDGPFESFALKAAVLSEPDGVAISGSSLSNTVKVRHGRLRLSNVFGSEKAALSMPLSAEYWSGQSWIVNADDNCTTLAAGNIALSGALAGSTSAAGVALSGGKGALVLAAPSPRATGSVNVAVNLGDSGSDQSCLAAHGGAPAQKSWLRSRNGSCASTYDRDPAARASFGVYSPETKKSVHIREVY